MPDKFMDNNSCEDQYKYKWITLTGLGMAMIVLNLDMTIVNLAIPILGKTFNAKISTLQWIINIYTLVFGASVILTGKLADKHGHKKMFLFGVSSFFIGSLIAGFSPGISIIIVGRLFQGIGMAATFGMVFILAAYSFPKKQRGIATGILIVFTGAGQAFGPTLGGLIVTYSSWRWCFLLNVPFCILSFILVYFACKKDLGDSHIKIHYPSALLLIISIFLIIGALNQTQNWGFSNWKFLVSFFIGIIIFTLNMFWQNYLKNPLISFCVYKSQNFLAVNLIRPFFQFSFSAFLFIFPLYMQNGKGYSAVITGLILLIMTIVIAFSSPITGKINDKIGPKAPIILSQIMAVIGYIFLSFVNIYNINWVLLSFGLVLTGLNIGIMFSSSNLLATISLPSNRKGVGFGMFTANAFISTSLGIAIIGYVYANVNLSHFYTLIDQTAHINAIDFKKTSIVHNMSGANPLKDLIKYSPQNADKIIMVGQKAVSYGFRISLWVLAALSLIGLGFCYFLKKED